MYSQTFRSFFPYVKSPPTTHLLLWRWSLHRLSLGRRWTNVAWRRWWSVVGSRPSPLVIIRWPEAHWWMPERWAARPRMKVSPTRRVSRRWSAHKSLRRTRRAKSRWRYLIERRSHGWMGLWLRWRRWWWLLRGWVRW